jgi:hypothetical protein
MTTPESHFHCTVVLDAGTDPNLISIKLKQIADQGEPFPQKIILYFSNGPLVVEFPLFSKTVEIIGFSGSFADLKAQIPTAIFAYLPASAPYSRPVIEGIEPGTEGTRPWVPAQDLPETEWVKQVYADMGWISTLDIFTKVTGLLSFLELEKFSQQAVLHPAFYSTPASLAPKKKGIRSEFSRLSFQARILALVPYYNCEPWLEQCLDSLVNQTRPLDAIAVLDDGSAKPPLEIVKRFKKVTLLRSAQNVGPYRLLQSAIEQINFDGYLFQDADDWCTRDRLERLLEEAELTDAEWIGTQELMVLENSIFALRYPVKLDSLRQSPLSQPFCYASSLISRKFLTRLGGFASGLRFSGDLELVNRALWTDKIRNLDRYCYFRRVRKDSLTTSETTGLGSPARREIGSQIAARKDENKMLVSKGWAPKLDPLTVAKPVVFERLTGPML